MGEVGPVEMGDANKNYILTSVTTLEGSLMLTCRERIGPEFESRGDVDWKNLPGRFLIPELAMNDVTLETMSDL